MSASIEEIEKIREVVVSSEKNGSPSDNKGSDFAADNTHNTEKISELVKENGHTLDKERDGTGEETQEPSEIASTNEQQAMDESSEDVILYEAALEFTALELSKATAKKLTIISAIITTIAFLLFVFSFPLSLFLILFCFDTKRSCSPFKAIRNTPWRLFLTKDALHYHLPNPQHRPYINLFYCMERVYKYRIPLKDIRRVSIQNLSTDQSGRESGTSPIASPKLEDIVIELKTSSLGVKVPVRDYLGLLSKCRTVHTLVIYSVRDASTFAESVKEHMYKSKHATEN